MTLLTALTVGGSNNNSKETTVIDKWVRLDRYKG